MLYLAIPAHNEVATIGVLLWRLRTVLAEFPREYEVVVYDDASTDETADVAEQYVNAMPVTVLRGRTPVGYAGAVDALVRHVAAATRYPRRDAMLLLQGDFTDPPGIVPEFARRFEGGADLVIGERTTVVDAPVPVRRLFTAARMALRPFVKVEGVRDLTGTMRLVRISVLRDLLRATDDAPVLAGDSVTANADLLLRLVPHARRIETVPVEPTYGVRMRETRRATLRDALASLRWGWSARGRRAAPSSAPEGTDTGARGARSERNERGERRDRGERGERGRVETELTAEGLRERLPERAERGDRDRDARGGRRERGREREPRAGRANGERTNGERTNGERTNGERTDVASGAQAATGAGAAEPKRERAPREPREPRESRPPREPREPRESNAGREPRPPRDRNRSRAATAGADAATGGPVDSALARALDDPFAPPVRREDPFASIDRITAGPGAPPDGDVVAGVPIAGSPVRREDPAGGADGDDTDDETSGDEQRGPRRRRSRRSRRGRGRNGEAGAEGAESEAGTGDSTRAAEERDADRPSTDRGADRPSAGREAAFHDAESRDRGEGNGGEPDSGDAGEGESGDGGPGDGMEIGEDGEPRARRRGRRGRRGGTRRSRRKREGVEGAEGAEGGASPGPGAGDGRGEGGDRGEGRDGRDSDGPYSDGSGFDRGDDGR